MNVIRRAVILVALATLPGCGEETANAPAPPASPTTGPSADATGATVDTSGQSTGSGARATGGLIDAPPATQPSVP